MKKVNIQFAKLVICFIGIVLLFSCAPLSTHYIEENVQEGKALVYIYRPDKYFHGGLDYIITANGVRITKLYDGGYYVYHAKPGITRFAARTETSSTVDIELEAGKVYYLKGTVREGSRTGRPKLTLVSNEVGKLEIAKCKLISEKEDLGY